MEYAEGGSLYNGVYKFEKNNLPKNIPCLSFSCSSSPPNLPLLSPHPSLSSFYFSLSFSPHPLHHLFLLSLLLCLVLVAVFLSHIYPPPSLSFSLLLSSLSPLFLSLPSLALFLSVSVSLSLSLPPPSLSPPSLFFCVSSSSSTTMNLKQWIPFTFSVTWVRAPTQVHSSTCHELAAAVCTWSGVPARHETQSPHTQRPQATQVSEGTVCADAALLWTWCGTGSGRI